MDDRTLWQIEVAPDAGGSRVAVHASRADGEESELEEAVADLEEAARLLRKLKPVSFRAAGEARPPAGGPARAPFEHVIEQGLERVRGGAPVLFLVADQDFESLRAIVQGWRDETRRPEDGAA